MDTNTLELMEQYCRESGELYNPTNIRKEITEYENKINKSFLEMDEWEIREMFTTFVNQKSSKHYHIIGKNLINNYISFYSRFFDWCIEKGYVKGTNIFLMRSLSSKEVCDMLQKKYKDEIPVLLEREAFDDICEQCRSLFTNGFYYEIILRLLYEGVIVKVSELEEIKRSDVSLEGQGAYIEHNGIRFRISDPLKELLLHMTEEAFTLNHPDTLTVTRINDSYMFFICKKGKVSNTIDYNFSSNQLKQLSDRMGYRITVDYIYYSGLYDYLLRKTDYDREKVYDMFYDGHYAINSVVKELTELAKGFGCRLPGKHIRTRVSKYRMEM